MSCKSLMYKSPPKIGRSANPNARFGTKPCRDDVSGRVIDPVFPATLGYAGAGVVVAVGDDAGEFQIGDKVSV